MKKKLKYQNISYERANEKAELQFCEELKIMKADSNNISILFYPTALCKLSPQKQFSKKDKRKMVRVLNLGLKFSHIRKRG